MNDTSVNTTAWKLAWSLKGFGSASAGQRCNVIVNAMRYGKPDDRWSGRREIRWINCGTDSFHPVEAFARAACWLRMKLWLMSLPSGHFMFRRCWTERTAGDQGRLRPESSVASAGMWPWLGFVLKAHGCLWFHKPRLPLMPWLEAVTAPGLGPGGFCELLMTRESEDSANLSYSRFSCCPQCPGLLGDLSGRTAAR